MRRKDKQKPKRHSITITILLSDYEYLKAEGYDVSKVARDSIESIVKQLKEKKQIERNKEMTLMESKYNEGRKLQR